MYNTALLNCNINLSIDAMTQQQVILIQRTWKIFREIKPEIVGDVFYSKLFAEKPSVKRLFKNPMNVQYKKLIDMISLIVGRLNHLDQVTEDIKQLAKRHVAYGVKTAHYKIVGDALMWTLEQGLGNDWNEDVRTAWTKCYAVIADTMITASRS